MAASRDRTNSLALNRRTTSLRLINSFTYSSSTKRASLCDGSNAQILWALLALCRRIVYRADSYSCISSLLPLSCHSSYSRPLRLTFGRIKCPDTDYVPLSFLSLEWEDLSIASHNRVLIVNPALCRVHDRASLIQAHFSLTSRHTPSARRYYPDVDRSARSHARIFA